MLGESGVCTPVVGLGVNFVTTPICDSIVGQLLGFEGGKDVSSIGNSGTRDFDGMAQSWFHDIEQIAGLMARHRNGSPDKVRLITLTFPARGTE
jgi:hypothetical protein